MSTYFSNMISRFHAEINGEVDDNNQYTCYFINDKSLNGTYINDTRVSWLKVNIEYWVHVGVVKLDGC